MIPTAPPSTPAPPPSDPSAGPLVPGLVSIVIIFLNGEPFLGEAIDSVLVQSYPGWELLLVDDGSSDASTETAWRYVCSRPHQIRYLEHAGHANRGMSASRNLGVKHARGEFVAFLDADDVWLPEKLAEQVAVLQHHAEAGMVYGPAQWWHGWTHRPADLRRDYRQALGVDGDQIMPPPRLVTLFLRSQGAIPSPSGVLVRRNWYDQIGGFEPEFRGAYEDQAFFAKLCLQAPVFVSKRCWYQYRQHSDSECARVARQGQYRDVHWTYLRWLQAYLDERAVQDGEVREALSAEMYPYRHPVLGRVLAGKQRLLAGFRRLRSMLAPASLLRRLSPGVQAVSRQFTRRSSPVRFGSLRRLDPVSRSFGFDRGKPIDRYYVEAFLARHAGDIRGRVLEVADRTYTQRFGGANVTCSEVLHATPDNGDATLVGDLASGRGIPNEAFDCIVLTQTLLCIFDVRAAVLGLHAALKPGGIALVTVPGISQISRPDAKRWGDFWRFTPQSAQRLFEEAFNGGQVCVTSHGNVLAATAFLQGLASEELHADELAYDDPDYPLLITIRAQKAPGRS